MSAPYLHGGLPTPLASDLDKPFWDGLREQRLLLQRCRACHRFQWGPEWICHRCQSFDFAFIEVPPEGRIYSWQRVWHPVHPALHTQGPYLIALIEIPHADNVRLVGNLLGDPAQVVNIGAEVEGVFEQHPEAEPPYALLQWQVV
jgi:uncharacterized OB-fold protein